MRLSGSNFLLGGGWQLAINDSLNVTYLGIDLIMRLILSILNQNYICKKK